MSKVFKVGSLIIDHDLSPGIILAEGGSVPYSDNPEPFNYVIRSLTSNSVHLVPTQFLESLTLDSSTFDDINFMPPRVIDTNGRFVYYSQKFLLSYKSGNVVLGFESSHFLGYKHFIQFCTINDFSVKEDSISVKIDTKTGKVGYSHLLLPNNDLCIINGLICLDCSNFDFSDPDHMVAFINKIRVPLKINDYLAKEDKYTSEF